MPQQQIWWQSLQKNATVPDNCLVPKFTETYRASFEMTREVTKYMHQPAKDGKPATGACSRFRRGLEALSKNLRVTSPRAVCNLGKIAHAARREHLTSFATFCRTPLPSPPRAASRLLLDAAATAIQHRGFDVVPAGSPAPQEARPTGTPPDGSITNRAGKTVVAS